MQKFADLKLEAETYYFSALRSGYVTQTHINVMTFCAEAHFVTRNHGCTFVRLSLRGP